MQAQAPELQQPDGHQGHARSDRAMGPEAAGQSRGLRRDQDHDEGNRDEPYGGGERAVAEHELEVQGEQEDDAVEGEEDQDHAAGTDGKGPVEEVADIQRRMVHPQLPQHEGTEHDDGNGERAERGPTQPSAARGFDETVDKRHDADGRQCRPDRVERRVLVVPGLRHEEPAADQRHEDQRDIDEEYRTPPEMGEEQAAGDRPQGARRAGDARPDGDRSGPLVRGKDVDEDRQRRRHDEGGPRPHQRPVGDHLPHGVGGGGEPGTDEEEDKSELEGSLASVAVADRPGREQEAGEDQRVGGDHPLQLGAVRVQHAGQRGQGDVQAGVAHEDDEQAEAKDREGPPAALEGRGGGRGTGGVQERSFQEVGRERSGGPSPEPVRSWNAASRVFSSAGSRPATQPVIIEKRSGSRPAAAAASSSTAFRERASSRVGKTVLYSSAYVIAAWTVRGFARPPTMIGGRGC